MKSGTWLRGRSVTAGLLTLATSGVALAAATTYIDTATQKESGFSNHLLTPFIVDAGVTKAGNYVQAFTKNGEPAVKTYWEQASYDGTRSTRGAEVVASNLKIYSDGWYGFRFMIPAGFPQDKELAIAQIFSRGGTQCSSWSTLLVVKNNSLLLRRRVANGCPTTPVDQVVAQTITRDAWNSVVLRFKVSRSNAGELKLWYNNSNESAPTVAATGLNYGSGDFTGDTLDPSVDNNYISLKFGQYDYDSANYTAGEYRVLYYDDVSMLNGNPAGAFTMVKP